jgi:hypothetical protein
MKGSGAGAGKKANKQGRAKPTKPISTAENVATSSEVIKRKVAAAQWIDLIRE